MIVKKFANKATTEYMNDREVRYVCVIPRNQTQLVGKILILAKRYGLILGKVVTMPSGQEFRTVSYSAGDVVLELVGILSSKRDTFLTAVESPSYSSVTVVKATASEINVSQNICKAIVVLTLSIFLSS